MSLTQWHNLLAWLHAKGTDISGLPVQPVSSGAARGLFATRHIPKGSTICSVPMSALLSIRTVSAIYPFLPVEESSRIPSSKNPPLNATQIIALHLCLHRPRRQEDSTDIHYGPYISILPRNFDEHPLTWLARQRQGISTNSEDVLLQRLPPSVRTELEDVTKGFMDDWERVGKCVSRFEERIPQPLDFDNFLWGWLTVNTRCVFARLFSDTTHHSNLALCPIFDLANHRSSEQPPQMTPAASMNAEAAIWGITMKDSGYFTFSMLQGHSAEAGQELFLRYGKHPNRTLFVQYGFVDMSPEKEGDVDITDVLDDIIGARGQAGSWMIEVLEEEGYKKWWSLHSQPAHPSYTLTMALRLANIELWRDEQREVDKERTLRPWRDCLQGMSETVSEQNELRAKRMLGDVCRTVILRSKKSLTALNDDAEIMPDWVMENIRQLWEEERIVAEGVLAGISEDQMYD